MSIVSAGAGRINPRFLIGGALLQPNLSAYTAGVIANQRLYDFGFTRNLVESSKMAERAQEQAVQAGRAIVAFNVQRSYYTSLKRKRLVDIAEQTVRERGVIKSQIEALHRQQLKSKLDLDLVQVELTNAQSLLVKAKNDLKAGYTDLNRVMGIVGIHRLCAGGVAGRGAAAADLGNPDYRDAGSSGSSQGQGTDRGRGSQSKSDETTALADHIRVGERR